VLLDDASLMEDASPDNPTAFRNAVVARLRELKPGVLRYMDNGNNFGSSIDNLLAVPYARERAGYNLTSADHEDVPIGLHDFLVLCQTLHTEPWFTMPAAMTQAEMTHLMEYLSAPATTPYGSRRAKMGQAAPWTTVFPMIHLELGNETWNSIFFGEAFPDPISYATRTGVIFGTARSSPFYDKNKIDLIMDGFVAYAGWNEQELSVKTNADTIDIAPYTFNEFNDASSTEAIFGPMFAEPEAMDSRPKGLVAVQAALAAKAGVKLAVYEVNLSTVKGTANAEQVEATVPSLGAGLSVADHMLLMLRDNGIMNQALFALPEYSNGFTDTSHPEANRSMKLWGSVVDMGGETNRVRPTFAAEALANSGIEDKMLETVQSGGNPTWNQPESANGKIKLSGAHMIQSFAFTDGKESSVILFNLSRTDGLPVTFSGSNPPQGAVQAELLTSANLTDTNESSEKVKTTTQAIKQFNPAHPYMLPPHSMTVLSWKSN
jgi:alpha-L-arabinofuranosidase